MKLRQANALLDQTPHPSKGGWLPLDDGTGVHIGGTHRAHERLGMSQVVTLKKDPAAILDTGRSAQARPLPAAPSQRRERACT